MKVKFFKQIEGSYYTCDICGERVIQDGKDICLVYSEDRLAEPVLHFHSSCLIKYFKKKLKNND